MSVCERCTENHNCAWQNHEETICHERPAFPLTNADRIRAMTDEELAKLFDSWIQDCDCNDVPCHKSCEENSVSGCINHWLNWLKEGANDE